MPLVEVLLAMPLVEVLSVTAPTYVLIGLRVSKDEGQEGICSQPCQLAGPTVKQQTPHEHFQKATQQALPCYTTARHHCVAF